VLIEGMIIVFFRNRRIKRLIPCILEIILALKNRGIPPNVNIISKRLGVNPQIVKRALDEAFSENLLLKDSWELTDSGRSLVLKHRGKFIHDKFMHKSPIFKFSGTFNNLSSHLKSNHGFSSNDVASIKDSLSSLQGRIEELIPLSKIPPKSKCVVVLTIGGYGFVRRLADMGLTPGVEVLVERNAPFGGPIIVQVRGSSVALGRGVASKILVRLLEA